MGPLSPQIPDSSFPTITSRTFLTTTVKEPEDRTNASIYSYRGGPTAGKNVPLSYMPVGDYKRVETDDELGLWANENRGVISPDLEQRLRDAHYLPSDNPDDISGQEWRDQHRVGYFELKRLQDLYAT